MTELLTVALLMSGFGVTLSVLLALADWKLYVWEDPRIASVEDMLPLANCGACGEAGCRAFAEAVVAGRVLPGLCTVNTAEQNTAIAGYLGVDAGGREKRVAMLACAGGSHVARSRALYEGLESCRAAALISGGGKGCSWGCLGLGDCEVVCDFDAISMDPHGLPVVDESLCTACNDCVEVCPKDLFSLHPVSHRLWVACRSLAEGEEAEAECEVACNGCSRCAADAEDGLIQIVDNLAVIDYSRNDCATPAAIRRCPTGAIVWNDEKRGILKGPAAKKITRHTPLPVPGELREGSRG